MQLQFFCADGVGDVSLSNRTIVNCFTKKWIANTGAAISERSGWDLTTNPSAHEIFAHSFSKQKSYSYKKKEETYF